MLTKLSNLHFHDEKIHSVLYNEEMTECIYLVQVASIEFSKPLYLIHAKADGREVYGVANVPLYWANNYQSYYTIPHVRRWTLHPSDLDLGQVRSFWYFVKTALNAVHTDDFRMVSLRQVLNLVRFVDRDTDHGDIVAAMARIQLRELSVIEVDDYQSVCTLYVSKAKQIKMYYTNLGRTILPVIALFMNRDIHGALSDYNDALHLEMLGRLFTLAATPKHQHGFFMYEIYRMTTQGRDILQLPAFEEVAMTDEVKEVIYQIFNLLSNPILYWREAKELEYECEYE